MQKPTHPLESLNDGTRLNLVFIQQLDSFFSYVTRDKLQRKNNVNLFYEQIYYLVEFVARFSSTKVF